MFLSNDQRQVLLSIARQSIEHGIQKNAPLDVEPDQFDLPLQVNHASFVTLKILNKLRGCIGTLEARMPLVKDVAEHAHAAAFFDPRFPVLMPEELVQINISISVLTPAEPLPFTSQEDLLEKIQAGEDGLILEEGRHRGTFLPPVWESLPEKKYFLQQLKRKAGLPEDYWSEDINISRYQTLEFAEN